METIEKVLFIVSDVLDVNPFKISAQASQDTVDEWDSLAQLRIVTALEEEFGIKPSMKEIGQLTSIPAITRYVESLESRT